MSSLRQLRELRHLDISQCDESRGHFKVGYPCHHLKYLVSVLGRCIGIQCRLMPVLVSSSDRLGGLLVRGIQYRLSANIIASVNLCLSSHIYVFYMVYRYVINRIQLVTRATYTYVRTLPVIHIRYLNLMFRRTVCSAFLVHLIVMHLLLKVP